MKSFKLNNKLNFVAGWYIDKKVCDQMIEYFEKTKKNDCGVKQAGKILLNGRSEIDKFIKDSIDLPINCTTKDEEPVRYLNELEKVCNLYKEKYNWSTANQKSWSIVEPFNIQKYPKKRRIQNLAH